MEHPFCYIEYENTIKIINLVALTNNKEEECIE